MRRSPITRDNAEKRLSRSLDGRRCAAAKCLRLRLAPRHIGKLRSRTVWRASAAAESAFCRALARAAVPIEKPTGTADRTNVHPPSASWRNGLATFPVVSVTSRPFGTGVEPATARFAVWCSTTELTDIDAARLETMFGTPKAESGDRDKMRWTGGLCAAGQTTPTTMP